MGCNCSKGVTYQYVYTPPTGGQVVYTSEVQAQAAKIRNGGGSYIKRPVQ